MIEERYEEKVFIRLLCSLCSVSSVKGKKEKKRKEDMAWWVGTAQRRTNHHKKAQKNKLQKKGTTVIVIYQRKAKTQFPTAVISCPFVGIWWRFWCFFAVLVPSCPFNTFLFLVFSNLKGFSLLSLPLSAARFCLLSPVRFWKSLLVL